MIGNLTMKMVVLGLNNFNIKNTSGLVINDN